MIHQKLVILLSLVLITQSFSCSKETRKASPELAVKILSAPCTPNSEALTAYHPGSPNLNFFNNIYYKVEWYQGNTLIGEGPQTNCLCGETITLIVKEKFSGKTVTKNYQPVICEHLMHK